MPRCRATRSALTAFTTRSLAGSKSPLMTIARSRRVSRSSLALAERYSIDTSVMPPTAICMSMRPSACASTAYGASRCIASGLMAGVLTAVAQGDPLSVATTASAISVATPSCASAVLPPRCGVTITSARPTSGWSAGGGSSTKTSSAAAATVPTSSARASASSSTTPPRATLTIRAPGRIASKASSSKRRSVACVSGTCSEKKSPRASASSKVTSSTPRLSARSRLA
mmetsp:Transcript_6165/g.18501  ORF Transcript_6165/g.18501 Transcript_6165/m.18501 type:complete len:228 (-) Transcript_6165:651-1334(-)